MEKEKLAIEKSHPGISLGETHRHTTEGFLAREGKFEKPNGERICF